MKKSPTQSRERVKGETPLQGAGTASLPGSRGSAPWVPLTPFRFRPVIKLNFAVASSVIKHTIHGDANITDDVKSIRNLADMNYDIRR